ncbi:hypothetical protein EDB87DRAFT_1825679 [Lactarius vividus]|nr:hypothetical protein EDB87DRAFT_1825679 [Lactarius vividus]
MPSASIAYPPIVQTCHDESSQIPEITDVQPSTGAEMVVGTDDSVVQSGKAERLRGGSFQDELVCAIPHFCCFCVIGLCHWLSRVLKIDSYCAAFAAPLDFFTSHLHYSQNLKEWSFLHSQPALAKHIFSHWERWHWGPRDVSLCARILKHVNANFLSISGFYVQVRRRGSVLCKGDLKTRKLEVGMDL